MVELNSLPRWMRLALAGTGLFVAGALLAFGYSYRPLHGAMTWRVAELEQRIDARNIENLKLGDELARLQSREASRIDPETFSQVERELGKTKKALSQTEKDLSRMERKRKDANASASRWRKRYEQLRDAPSHPAAVTPTPTAPEPSLGFSSGAASRPIGQPASGSPAALESGMISPDPTATPPAPSAAP